MEAIVRAVDGVAGGGDDRVYVVKKGFWSAEQAKELSCCVQKEGGSLENLNSRSAGSRVNGGTLQGLERSRGAAIAWLAAKFAACGWRDEWLSAVIFLMDRAASVAAAKSAAAEGASPMVARPASSPISPAAAAGFVRQSAAERLMSCGVHWLAAVLSVLKLSEADNELGSPEMRDVLLALSARCPDQRFFGQSDNRVWEAIVKTEFRLMHMLSYRLAMPSSMDLTSRIALDVCAAAPDTWAGLQEITMPSIFLPCRTGGQATTVPAPEDVMGAGPSSQRLPTVCCLAFYLVDLAIVHRPAEAYGMPPLATQPSGQPAAALAIAALAVAVQAFAGGEEAAAAERCVEALREAQATVLSDDELQRYVPTLISTLSALWSRPPAMSPVTRRWQVHRAYAVHGPTPCQCLCCPVSDAVAEAAAGRALKSLESEPPPVLNAPVEEEEAPRTPQRKSMRRTTLAWEISNSSEILSPDNASSVPSLIDERRPSTIAVRCFAMPSPCRRAASAAA
jgi:hypothetical protein